MTQYTKYIIDKLPSSWKDMTLKQFMSVIGEFTINYDDELISPEVYKACHIIAALSGEDVNKLTEFGGTELLEAAGERLSFMNDYTPIEGKPSLKIKEVDEISTNDYMLMAKITGNENWKQFLPVVMKSFTYKSKQFDRGATFFEPYSKEEIDNMSMQEVYLCFFILNLRVKKFFDATRTYLEKQLKTHQKNEKKKTRKAVTSETSQGKK